MSATAYQPLNIKGTETGLVQQRQNFLIANDAYPVLENAYIFREKIQRKQGYELLGRLRRDFEDVGIGSSAIGVGPIITSNFNILRQTGYILTISQAANAVFTTRYPHELSNGNDVEVSDVAGAMGAIVNNSQFQITVLSPTTFQSTTPFNTLATPYTGGGIFAANVTLLSLGTEVNAQLVPGSVSFVFEGAPPITYTDLGNGVLTGSINPLVNKGTINYSTGAVTIDSPYSFVNIIATWSYYPGLPAMGIRTRELQGTTFQNVVFFDTRYAYKYVTDFEEFLPGTIWTGLDSDFFWSTNYWVDKDNNKIFWETNDSGTTGDPIRYTNGLPGTNWIDFAPTIDNAGNKLTQCVAMLPFRGRMVAFNTLEGTTLANSIDYRQRIRWAEIGNPFDTVSAIVTTVVADAWRDDVIGKGGFLDIPTSENINAVGFVRDNLVIYCEHSTWQLRYTGRSISPFQIEKVNSELGAESTFSAVQFDKSLVGVGDKGIIECDSFQSERIDIKIVDLVFQFSNNNFSQKRVHGIRDFVNRLAYWTYVYTPDEVPGTIFPNRRLVYNYENDSWAIFTDSLTCLGTFQPPNSRRWIDCNFTWSEADFTWNDQPLGIPDIVGGNQQGFIEILDQKISNDVSLFIQNITSDGVNPTVVTSPNHNLLNNYVIQISGILGTPYSTLNGQIFGVSRLTSDTVALYKYNPVNQSFDDPQLNASDTYVGGGLIAIRDGFSIMSKQFNYMDDGQKYQLGYVDILCQNTETGAFTMNVYIDYDDNTPTNTIDENLIAGTQLPDTVFNSVIPTNPSALGINGSPAKSWQRVFCATRANFVQIEYTLSNAQLIGVEQENDVQIDAQILWSRPAGRIGI